jgi:hypothetical protein
MSTELVRHVNVQLSERAGAEVMVDMGDGPPRKFNRRQEPFEVSPAEAEALIKTGLFEPAEVVRLRLVDGGASKKVGVAHGPFRRSFVRDEQPFTVTRRDWETHLDHLGYFEVVEEAPVPVTTTTTTTTTDAPPPPRKAGKQTAETETK